MNKFEKEIQEKFQNREIQPSASAWERLSDQLDAQGQKKKKGWLLYIGYAASIVLIISLFFLLNEDETNTSIIPENVIVNKEIEAPKTDEKLKEFKEVVQTEEVLVENTIPKEKKKSVEIESKKSFKAPVLVKSEKTVVVENSKKNIDARIDKTIDIKEAVKITTAVVNKETKIKDSEKDASKFKPITTGVSVDSDALLFAVTHSKEEIRGYYKKYKISRADVLKTIEKELKKSKLKIDPNTILAEVEMEVNEESFQNNFYQLIKKRVSDVATAIANRNN